MKHLLMLVINWHSCLVEQYLYVSTLKLKCYKAKHYYAILLIFYYVLLVSYDFFLPVRLLQSTFFFLIYYTLQSVISIYPKGQEIGKYLQWKNIYTYSRNTHLSFHYSLLGYWIIAWPNYSTLLITKCLRMFYKSCSIILLN